MGIMGYALGIILILIGIFIKFFPHAVNFLSPEEKKKMNMKKLASILCRGCIFMGITCLAFAFICHLFQLPESYSLLTLPFFFLGLLAIVTIGLVKGKKKA